MPIGAQRSGQVGGRPDDYVRHETMPLVAAFDVIDAHGHRAISSAQSGSGISQVSRRDR